MPTLEGHRLLECGIIRGLHDLGNLVVSPLKFGHQFRFCQIEGTIRSGVAAEAMEKDGTGWRLRTSDGDELRTDAVVLASPAYDAAALLRGHDENVGDLLYGNIGVPSRIEFSVIGRAANEVSRLESLTRDVGEQVLASRAFVEAMNAKAAELGMQDTRFSDSSGLHSGNVSTARDLARLVEAAWQYEPTKASGTRRKGRWPNDRDSATGGS